MHTYEQVNFQNLEKEKIKYRSIHVKKYMENLKFKVGWGFTRLCNMRCRMCYSWRVRQRRDEIDLEVAKSFVYQNRDYIENLNFGTGENTLVLDWYNLLKWNNELGLKQGVTTNGYLAIFCEEHKWAHEIVTNCINDVDTSIDFANPILHNTLRGHPKAFQWAIKTLRYCHDYDIERSIVVCLLSENSNIKNIKNIFRLAENFQCNVRFNIYRPLHGSNFIVPPKQLYDVLQFCLKNYNLVRASDPLFSALLGINHAIGDSAGTTSCRILPNGMITPSTYLIGKEWETKNIKERPLLPKLRETESFKKLINGLTPTECKECTYAGICQGGAKDRRVLWYHDLSKRDPYCPYLHLNYNPLGEIDFKITKQARYFVHDGYLPTLIFAP